MAFEFVDEAPAKSGFEFVNEPQAQPAANAMAEVGDRKLPPLWDARVTVDSQEIPVRGVFDQDAKAYLVAGRDGKAYYINKNQDGSLGLKPYSFKPSSLGTTAENIAAGAGKAVVDTKRGIQQLGTLAGNTLGLISDEAVDESFANAAADRERDADLMHSKAGLAGNVAGNIAGLALGGGLIKGAGAGAGKLGLTGAETALKSAGAATVLPKNFKQAATVGAGLGFIQPATSMEDKALQTGIGAAAGTVGQAAAKGLSRATAGASDVISPEVKRLAELARSKWGINLRGDQVVNSKPLNAMSAALDYVPFSGTQGSKMAVQKQFNQALSKSIGQASDNPAYAIKQAETALGSEFDRVLQGTAVRADDALQSDISSIVSNARNEMTDAQFGVLQRQVDNLLGKVGDGDVIDGAAAYNIKKGLDRLGKSSDSTLANYAGEMKTALMDALNRSLGPEEAAKFASTRSQYSNLMAIRKIIPRGAEADISPARLANMRGYMSKDLNELADIAATFLKPRIGDSGTAQRSAALASVPVALSAPATLGASVAGGATLGRGLNALMDSPLFVNYLLNGATKAAPIAGPARVAPSVLPAFLESYMKTNPQ